MLRTATALAILAVPVAVAGAAVTRTVCPRATGDNSCHYVGDEGIQAAVDAARDDDVIHIRAGTYSPTKTRDVPFEKLQIRGYVVVDGKNLELTGEPGTVLDGAKGVPASAIVVRGGNVTVRNLTVRGFRWDVEEDDTYDGHGLFFIDTRATVHNVIIEKTAKMALTVRGKGIVTASDLRITEGHVGIWLEETAHLELRNAVVRGNDSAGLCAYAQSTATVDNSVFENNQDDGLYAANDAAIEVRNSKISGNRPLDVNAIDKARISVTPASTPVSR